MRRARLASTLGTKVMFPRHREFKHADARKRPRRPTSRVETLEGTPRFPWISARIYPEIGYRRAEKRLNAADRRRAPANNFRMETMVETMGLEPTTFWMQTATRW